MPSLNLSYTLQTKFYQILKKHDIKPATVARTAVEAEAKKLMKMDAEASG